MTFGSWSLGLWIFYFLIFVFFGFRISKPKNLQEISGNIRKKLGKFKLLIRRVNDSCSDRLFFPVTACTLTLEHRALQRPREASNHGTSHPLPHFSSGQHIQIPDSQIPKSQIPKSEFQNSNSKINNPKSKIQIPEFQIQKAKNPNFQALLWPSVTHRVPIRSWRR